MLDIADADAFAGERAGAGAQRSVWSDSWRVTLCLLVWLNCVAWMRPLMGPDEGRYVGVAWEMLRSGDWLTPRLDGLPFFHKPPLFYWLTALSLKLFGATAWAGRNASLIGALLGALSTYWFTRRWYGLAQARRALLVLLVLPLFFAASEFANLDMLVAGCIVATVMALAHCALSAEQGQPHSSDSRRILLLAYVLAGLGVLSKGLIGVVLPAAIIGCWLLSRRQWRSIWALCSLPGLLLLLAVVVPWFVVMDQRYPQFSHYFFVVQHLERFASTGFNNVQPWWFYPAILLLSSAPFLLCLPAFFRSTYWRDSKEPGQAAVRQLMGWSVGCVVLFFSLPQSKLLGYVLPAVPALAWLLADAWGPLLHLSPGRKRWWWASVALCAGISLVIPVVLTLDQRHSAKAMDMALLAQRHSSEPVYMVDGYVYDTAFYARLQEPVTVVDDWTEQKSDNWRKELRDAGAFEPERARKILIQPAQWREQLCHTPVSWVIGGAQIREKYPYLAEHAPVFDGGKAWLWKIDMAQEGAKKAWGCTQ